MFSSLLLTFPCCLASFVIYLFLLYSCSPPALANALTTGVLSTYSCIRGTSIVAIENPLTWNGVIHSVSITWVCMHCEHLHSIIPIKLSIHYSFGTEITGFAANFINILSSNFTYNCPTSILHSMLLVVLSKITCSIVIFTVRP